MSFVQDRWKICKGCEHLTKMRLCSKCGCYMPVKVRVKKVECPIKKWSKES